MMTMYQGLLPDGLAESVPPASGVPLSLTYTDNRADGSANATVTYNAGGDPNCGAADLNRIIVVIMGRRMTGGAPTSVTIAGVSATQVSGAFNAGSGIQQSDIWYAAVPTGTTCSVAVAWDPAGSGYSDSVIGVYRLITATPAPTASANASVASGAVTLPAYTVPSGGASVNMWSQRDNGGASAVSWTNTSAANGDFFVPGINARGYSGSTVQVAGSVTVSADRSPPSNTDVATMSAAAWGP